MQKLKFRDFIDTYIQHEDLVGECPSAIRLNAATSEIQTWSELEKRLRAAGANDDLCRTGKRIWRRYRVASRSSLA